MTKYMIFFEQINRRMITITAKTEEEAITKASKEWRTICREETEISVED